MKHNNRVFTSPKRRTGEQIVQNGLSLSPANALKMAEQGLPSSAQMQYREVEGSSNPAWGLPLDERRGIDMAALWQAQRDIKAKFVQAHDAGTVVNNVN